MKIPSFNFENKKGHISKIYGKRYPEISSFRTFLILERRSFIIYHKDYLSNEIILGNMIFLYISNLKICIFPVFCKVYLSTHFQHGKIIFQKFTFGKVCFRPVWLVDHCCDSSHVYSNTNNNTLVLLEKSQKKLQL